MNVHIAVSSLPQGSLKPRFPETGWLSQPSLSKLNDACPTCGNGVHVDRAGAAIQRVVG
jgi:hypothetical protein